jgi:hypothetical protein
MAEGELPENWRRNRVGSRRDILVSFGISQCARAFILRIDTQLLLRLSLL